MDKRLLKFSPLTEATYYILISLNSPLHGYGIIKKVERLTDNRLRLAPGTLYGAVSTLLDNQLIDLISEDKGSKGKKMYETPTVDGGLNCKNSIEHCKYEGSFFCLLL